MANEIRRITNQYMPGDETSFTIIAFPRPEIGKDFPGIFEDTIALNTLDYEKYQKIQQTMIDALDEADRVHKVEKIIEAGSTSREEGITAPTCG